MYYFDNTFLLLIPAIILTLYAQSKVQSTYRRFQKVLASCGRTGAEIARDILDRMGLHEVGIEVTKGYLGDHYDPRTRTVRLSEENYANPTLAAIAVAAHEVGHALQHKENYGFLKFRTALFPVASVGSNLAIPLFFIGLIFTLPGLMDLGIIFFTLAVAFQIVTLPVEFNASKRALAILQSGGYLAGKEHQAARKVLDAAALTYVAAAAMAVLTLLRLLILRSED